MKLIGIGKNRWVNIDGRDFQWHGWLYGFLPGEMAGEPGPLRRATARQFAMARQRNATRIKILTEALS